MTPRLFGRAGSHFTRVARIFADECGVDIEFVVVSDLRSVDVADYGGNPCLQVPTLQLTPATTLRGTENICRALHGRAATPLRIAWPDVDNASEALRFAMNAEVQLVLAPERTKPRAALLHALTWLDAHIDDVTAALPPRDLSLFEVSLFCLIEHIAFRRTAGLPRLDRVQRVVDVVSARPSAQRTRYGNVGGGLSFTGNTSSHGRRR